MATSTKKSGAGADAAPVPVKLPKVALGQLIQVATNKRLIGDISPGALAELSQAGMLEQKTAPLREDQTLEWQIKQNKEALAKLAHWAKTACPRDPFKGGPNGQTNGWMNGRHVYHPAAAAWGQIKKPQEYKACPKTVLSDKAWAALARVGVEKPRAGDEGKPCGNG